MAGSAESQPAEALVLGRHTELDLELLARQHLPRIERLLLRILGPRADMEDLVQMVFVELCRSLPRYRGDSSISTFIGGITVRVARRAMRPAAWWTRRAPMPAEATIHGVSPEEDAIGREQMRQLRQALERLKPKKRVAFCLWAFEGLEVSEIAALTGGSEAATRSQIYYAQRELRALAERDVGLREALGER